MKVLFDTTVLVAAIWAEHPLHREASAWILKVRGGEVAGFVAQHSLLEAYASLTGMPSRPKLPPAIVKQAILEAISGVEIAEAGARQYQSILDRAETSGLSGGIVYDLLIWLSAEEVGADLLVTANAKDFVRFEAATGPRVQGLS